MFTYRICLGLQRHDREVLEHGVETGIIQVMPTGEFIEVHQPLGPTDHHGHGMLPYAGTPVPKRMNQLGAATPLRHVRGFFFPVTEKPEIQAAIDELEAAEAASSQFRDQRDRPTAATRRTSRPSSTRSAGTTCTVSTRHWTRSHWLARIATALAATRCWLPMADASS